MGLETGTYLDDLVTSNPIGATDPKSQGDNHLRLIKSVLKNTFPNADRAFRFPRAESISGDETVVAADQHRHYLVDASGGDVTLTLPTLTSGDDGWAVVAQCVVAGNNVIVAPASGTINGAANVSVDTQFGWIMAVWSGSVWYALVMPKNTISDFIETLLDDADAATARATLGLVIGTDVQAFSSMLASLAALSAPGADRILFWDHSGLAFKWLTVGTGLEISGTTLQRKISDFVYTGSDASNTSFPISTYVMATVASGPTHSDRNGSIVVRLSSGNKGFTTLGATSALAGTWRARGHPDNNDAELFQRTA